MGGCQLKVVDDVAASTVAVSILGAEVMDPVIDPEPWGTNDT
ncbi:unannotated protein [freshwater metagenome]|uniref:Unannotated protein n=1 Tax=freshwater metagenome TaxID=449393 RepID=A0A6J6FR54_9ZZZZ